MSQKDKQARNLCFTLNNYTDDEYEVISNIECAYIVIGKEVGESGTPHLQGYVEFKGGKRFSTLKKICERIHWEVRRGTAVQASDYCKKEGNFIEKGTISNQGKRTDILEATDLITDGNSLEEVALACPEVFVKYHRGLEALSNSLMKHRTEKPFITWVWGLAGRGKSHYCTERHPNHYLKDGTKWWNNYKQEESILIDDFDGKWPFRDLLRLLDKYKYQGQTKGGYVKINSPFIYITCEFPPSHFWEGNALEQVVSRIDVIHELKGPNLRLKPATEDSATEVAGNTIQPQTTEEPKNAFLKKYSKWLGS